MRVKVKQKNASRRMRSINRALKKVPQRAYEKFKSVTPIRTGNAKRSTKLVNKETIFANYPYAERLDKGYSRQAPVGMSIPTFALIKRLVRRIFVRGG